MESTPSPHDQEQDQEIIDLLESLKAIQVDYPPDLLAARRAAFVAQVKQSSRGEIKDEVTSGRQFTKRLRELGVVRAEYPSDLLAARRTAFIAQVEQHAVAQVREELTSEDQEIIKLLKRIKALEPGYPPQLLAARRSAFLRQLLLEGQISVLDVWRYSLQRLLQWNLKLPSLPMLNTMRTSAVVAFLILAVFIGSLFRTRQQVLQASPAQDPVAQAVPVLAANTDEVPKIICKPGYLPPLCLAKEIKSSEDLTYQGNGVARPAVAKDTVPGYSGVHDPAYVNDGLYGPGSSWVSNSAYSWIKIDLGQATTINTVAFGRDRLGHLRDGNPGHFVIAVALSDDIYADGNSSNDYIEYTEVYYSQAEGFSGRIAGPETVRAAFGPVKARFIKIIFENPGTAVDEVEAFMVQPPVLVEEPTRKPKDDEVMSVAPTATPSRTPLPTSTASHVPTDTLAPTDTSTPLPTNTLPPTNTFTPVPTNTLPPTNTFTPVPTNTPLPTRTPTPVPTNTLPPTRTPTLVPTATPQPTSTPVPTDTPVPVPTNTAIPASTDTLGSLVEPTNTPTLLDDF